MSMSAKEYSSLMKEMGVTSSSGVDGDSIRVEHVLVFSMTEKWERALDKWVHLTLDLSREMVASLRLIATATSIAIVLWGTSKLIASFRSNHDESTTNHEDGEKK
jgi:hypothetical protein